MIRYSTDVIVIGAGIAGVTAAIELLSRGRRVLLLDRDAEENMGGLAKESFGGIWFAGTPLQKRYGIRDGAQQGLDLFCRALLDPGDAVAVESPTYGNLLPVLRLATTIMGEIRARRYRVAAMGIVVLAFLVLSRRIS